MPDIVAAAEQLAREKHAGQVDKQGRPYADAHLWSVAALLRMFGPAAEAAGWLHDLHRRHRLGLPDHARSGDAPERH